MVVDAAAQRAVLTKKIPHLADGAAHGHELRGEPHLGLGLATLDPLDAVDQVGAQPLDALVRLVEGPLPDR